MQLRSRSWRPRAVAAIVVVLGASALVASCSRGSAGRDAANAGGGKRDAVLTVSAAQLEPVELARTVTVNGAIYAWQEVIIAPEVGGYRVAEVNVDVGDHVKRGQSLVELSTALLQADVATKQAILRQREAELVNADAALERGKSLSNMNLLSQADLDRLNSDALARRAAVESSRADLEASSLRLKFTHVTAPDDGVVTSRTVTVGQIAQAGSEMLRVLRNNRIEWRGEIPEARITELRAGQPATITTADGKAFKGTIRVVAPTIASSNRTGLVYVDLTADERLRPGMFARGEIELGRAPAFTVPLQSVVSSDGYSYVFVLKSGDTVERRRVETGAVRTDQIEVIDGIQAGEMIVGKGAGFLKDGDVVNVSSESGS
jgi:RND family efflux transporter MFP subunit